VVPEAGQVIGLGDVVEWLSAARFAKQKLPERLIVVDELPRTAAGKVQKFKLRELAKGSPSNPGAEPGE